MNLKSAILVMALSFGAFAPTVSSATTLAPLTDEQMVDASTYVVEGTITEVWVEFDEGDMIWTRAKLSVSKVFKGKDDPTELIIDSLGGEIGDEVMSVPGSARFSEGEQVLVFLADIRNGTRLTPVAMHQGKYTIRRAPGDVDKYVTRWRPRDSMPYDHRFIPHTNFEDRIYLNDVQSRINIRIDTGWDGKPIPGISPEKLTEINQPLYRRVR